MNDQGVLVIGPSGSGKSRLALELMAFGAKLVADDGVWLRPDNWCERPEQAPHLIEARGIGLLHADILDAVPVSLVIDLTKPDPERLPPRRQAAAPGGPIPLILGGDHPFLAAAVCQYMRYGRAE